MYISFRNKCIHLTTQRVWKDLGTSVPIWPQIIQRERNRQNCTSHNQALRDPTCIWWSRVIVVTICSQGYSQRAGIDLVTHTFNLIKYHQESSLINIYTHQAGQNTVDTFSSDAVDDCEDVIEYTANKCCLFPPTSLRNKFITHLFSSCIFFPSSWGSWHIMAGTFLTRMQM